MLHTLEPISEIREITENPKTDGQISSRLELNYQQQNNRSLNRSAILRARSRESSKAQTENTLNISVQGGASQRSWRSMKSREFLSRSIDPTNRKNNQNLGEQNQTIGDLEMVEQLTETFGTIRKNQQRVVVNFERSRYDFESSANPPQRSQREEISLEKTLAKYQRAKQFFETQKKLESEKDDVEEIPETDEQAKDDHSEIERKFYLPVLSFKYEKYSERKSKKKVEEKKPSRQPTPSYARERTKSPLHRKEESQSIIVEVHKNTEVSPPPKDGGRDSHNSSLIRLKQMPTEGQVSDKKMAAAAPVVYKSPALKNQEFIENMRRNIAVDTIHHKLSEKVRRAQNDIIKKGNFSNLNERVLRSEFDKILSGLGGRNKTIRKGNVIEQLRKESSAMPPSYKLY